MGFKIFCLVVNCFVCMAAYYLFTFTGLFAPELSAALAVTITLAQIPGN